MNRILLFLFVYLCLGFRPCEESRVRAYLDDSDAITNVRQAPNGEVIFKLQVLNDEIPQMDILAVKDKWLFIEIMEDSKYIGKKGWIYRELVGIDTRNYQNERVNLYTDPNINSKVINHFIGEQHVKVYKVCGSWAYIHFIDDNGNSVEGWLEPAMQCGNPYTNCS